MTNITTQDMPPMRQSPEEPSAPLPMALYIKVENGQTVDHPVLPGNLLEVFGQIPDNYEPFIRIPESERIPLNTFEVWDTEAAPYVKHNGVWTDVYARRQMTAEEKLAEEIKLLDAHKKMLEWQRQYLQKKKAAATLPADVAAWEEWIAKLDMWDFGPDLANPQFPNVPAMIKRDANGNLVTTDNQGSAPDVIG